VSAYDVDALRAAFPGLAQQIHGKPLVYLDHAATSMTPEPVLAVLRQATALDRANVHRGVHTLSQRASDAFEAARAEVAAFVGAADPREIVWVRGTTEGINLLAQTWGRANLGAGDVIVVTAMEHHSNLVPWQQVAAAVGATLRVLPHDARGVLDLDAPEAQFDAAVKLVAAVHVSNTLGTVNPIATLAARAHAVGAKLFVDGAQSAPHMPIDVAALGCDAFVFSGHKVCGPFGIGAVWAPLSLWSSLPPWQGGGGMIGRVTLQHSTWAEPPMRFEAGTPDVAGAVALAAALRFLRGVGLSAIGAHEARVLAHATSRLEAIPGLRILGTAPHKASVCTFVVDGAPASDLGAFLDQRGIAVRTGHHCTQPVMDAFGVPAAVRASFGLTTTHDEVDRFADALVDVLRYF
jgi:cysteine desulfurase/selenocysteine lyase